MVITSLSSGYDLQHRTYLLEIHSLWTREVGIAGMTRCPLPRPSRPSRQQPARSGHGCASGASNWGCPRRLWPTSPNCTGRSSARSSAVSATSASTTSCASLVPWTSIPAIWCEGCDDQRVETVWSCASQYGTHRGYAPLQSSESSHFQGVVYQSYGDVGQVEAVEDVIVEHDRLQVVEADEVNELVDAL